MSTYCTIYDMGQFDHVEEEGTKEVCTGYITACQSAYDKPLRVVPAGEVRHLGVVISEVVTSYEIGMRDDTSA